MRERHAQLAGRRERPAVEGRGRARIPRPVTTAEESREVVLAVGRPGTGAHPLVELDRGRQVPLGLVEAPERRREQPEIAIDGPDAALRVGDGVAAREGRQLLVEHRGGRDVAEAGGTPRPRSSSRTATSLSRYSAAKSARARSSNSLRASAFAPVIEQQAHEHRPEQRDTRGSRRSTARTLASSSATRPCSRRRRKRCMRTAETSSRPGVIQNCERASLATDSSASA